MPRGRRRRRGSGRRSPSSAVLLVSSASGVGCGMSITARPPTCPGVGAAAARSSASCSLIRSRTRSVTASSSRSARTSVSCLASCSSSSSSSAYHAMIRSSSSGSMYRIVEGRPAPASRNQRTVRLRQTIYSSDSSPKPRCSLTSKSGSLRANDLYRRQPTTSTSTWNSVTGPGSAGSDSPGYRRGPECGQRAVPTACPWGRCGPSRPEQPRGRASHRRRRHRY